MIEQTVKLAIIVDFASDGIGDFASKASLLISGVNNGVSDCSTLKGVHVSTGNGS